MKLLKRTTALMVATLVLGAAGCSKPSGDAAITSQVKAAISKEPGLKGTTVSVSTDQNVVLLSGTVKSRAERAMLLAVARKVEGVKAVKTELVVQAELRPKVAEQKPKVTAQKKPAAEAPAKQEVQAQQRVTQRAPEFAGTGR